MKISSPISTWETRPVSGRAAEIGIAALRETLWNVRHRGHPMPLPGAADFDKRVDASWPLLNLIQVEGYAQTSERDNVWVDPAPGATPNLYVAQLRKRLGL